MNGTNAIHFFIGLLPSFIERPLRRYYRGRRRKRLENLPPININELRDVLARDLQFRLGATMFVHASFSELHVEGTPDDLVRLLTELVGPQGNILMPFYPIKSSHEWLVEGKPFDLRKHRTSMGALATSFAKLPGVRKSIHPTKSVAGIGKDMDFLLGDHALSPMPYGEKSPYFRVGGLPASYIVGLGVGSDYLSCMHVAVDTSPDYPIQPYHPDALSGVVIDHDGREHAVKTYAHDIAITGREDVPRFLTETNCPTYRELVYKDRVFFIVEAKALIEHVRSEGKKGRTFFYPASLNFKQPKRNPVA